MTGRTLTATAVLLIAGVLLLVLAVHHPIHRWADRSHGYVGPKQGVVVLREANYESVAMFDETLNRLHARGYTMRACAGGIGGRMCVMEMDVKLWPKNRP